MQPRPDRAGLRRRRRSIDTVLAKWPPAGLNRFSSISVATPCMLIQAMRAASSALSPALPSSSVHDAPHGRRIGGSRLLKNQ